MQNKFVYLIVLILALSCESEEEKEMQEYKVYVHSYANEFDTVYHVNINPSLNIEGSWNWTTYSKHKSKLDAVHVKDSIIEATIAARKLEYETIK